MDTSQSSSPFLIDNFAPIRSEDDFELEVVGEIPADLVGTLYRDGPNPQFEPRDHYHWFFGDGMIHAFFVEGGRVRYRNRYVRTPKWLAEHAAGRSLFGTFGNPATTDPNVIGRDSGVANTNVVWHAGRLLALEEAHKPFEIDPVSLESRGYVEQFRGRVTAHPKIDPNNGEMVWFAYSSGQGPLNATDSYGVSDATGNVIRRDDFEAPYCSMIHDFQMTEGHVLFPVLPLTGSMQRAMAGGPAFAWEPDKGAFVGVMARDAGVDTIRWFNTDACFVFHSMNAWEEEGRIFADVMEYPAAPLFPNADGRPTKESDWTARLVRWTFDLADNSDRIKREPLDDLPGEFPRFDERRAGLPYRHGWFASNSPGRQGVGFFDAIAHVDLITGKRSIYEIPNGDGLSEPVFVPRAANAPEGDGWLVLVAYRRAEDRSDFLVFDAQNIGSGPIASAKVPRRVPFGFHGNWRPAAH
jgi:carotenoid cleavage dioxygenase